MSDKLTNALLIVLAAVMAGVVVVREVRGPRTVERSFNTARPPEYVKDWEKMVVDGVELDNPKAPVKVLEFMDFECPFCRRFHETMEEVQRQYPQTVSRVFLHLPIPSIHRFALPAARAAECAGEQGKFLEMHGALLRKQDSLGLKPWTAYATDVGVPNVDAFGACISRTGSVPRIEAGMARAKELELRGTPSVIIGGWRFESPPTKEILVATIEAVLSGKSPP